MERRSQEERSRGTRTVLEQAARKLFTQHGFTAISADELVATAGVTRGALQYHYGDKRGLFLAVLDRLELENAEEIRAAIAGAPDPDDLLAALAIGFDVFLQICQRPEMAQIGLSDAPAVLGWQAWREFEIRHGLGLIVAQLEAARSAGTLVDAPIDELAQLLLSAVTEAGLMVAHAPDPAARTKVHTALMILVAGTLRT